MEYQVCRDHYTNLHNRSQKVTIHLHCLIRDLTPKMGNSMNLPLVLFFQVQRDEREKKKHQELMTRTLRPPAASEKIRKNGGTLRGRCQQKTTEDLTAGFHHHSLDFLFCSDRFT